MPKYEVEVAGEYTETVWGFYEIEADSVADAEEQAAELFDGDNWGAEIVSTYTSEVEDEEN